MISAIRDEPGREPGPFPDRPAVRSIMDAVPPVRTMLSDDPKTNSDCNHVLNTILFRVQDRLFPSKIEVIRELRLEESILPVET